MTASKAEALKLSTLTTVPPSVFSTTTNSPLADDANDTETSTVTFQALHNLSDHMYVYFEGYRGGGDDGVYGVADESERSIASVGGVYYF